MKKHLLVATPCYGGMINYHYMMAIIKLEKDCARRGVTFELLVTGGDALITRARNTIATHFLEKTEATHLLFIDADISFEPEEVARLLDFDADLSGGLYPLKNIDWDLAQRSLTEGKLDFPAAALNYVMGFEEPASIETRGGFGRAKYVGNGFMMVKRRVFEVLEQRHPELKFSGNVSENAHRHGPEHCYAFFDCMIDEEGIYLPEDYAFCRRWLDAGGEIWVDFNSRLTHHGTYAFAGNAALVFKPNQ